MDFEIDFEGLDLDDLNTQERIKKAGAEELRKEFQAKAEVKRREIQQEFEQKALELKMSGRATRQTMQALLEEYQALGVERVDALEVDENEFIAGAIGKAADRVRSEKKANLEAAYRSEMLANRGRGVRMGTEIKDKYRAQGVDVDRVSLTK